MDDQRIPIFKARDTNLKKQKSRKKQEISPASTKENERSKEEEKCQEIDDLKKKHDGFNLHKKIKEMCYLRTYSVNVSQDKDNNYINERGQRLNSWREYMEKLFEYEHELENIIITTGLEIS